MGSACGGSLNRGHAPVGPSDVQPTQNQAQGQSQAGSSTAQGTGVRQGTPIIVEDVKEGGTTPGAAQNSAAIPVAATVVQPSPTQPSSSREGCTESWARGGKGAAAQSSAAAPAAAPAAQQSPAQSPAPRGGSAAGAAAGAAASAAAAEPSGKTPSTCSRPGCQKPASGFSVYCSIECMDEAQAPQKASQPQIDPHNDAVVFRDPRSQFGDSVGVIGFYYPDREEDCDKICGAGFLGNFWETPEKIRLAASAPGSTGPSAQSREHRFRNAEAAFQALKFWADAPDFEELTGDEAFLLKKQKQGLEDFTYGGKGDNWKGMRAVLDSKFAPKSAMAEALCKTSDTFLLEHNSVKGRDDIWSDNYDGEGKNWLGMQLMLIRDKLASRREWTDFIGGLVSLETGAPLDSLKGRKWQDAVRSARDALMVKVEEIRPKPPCSRVGCGKPSWNNQPGEYCSKDCRKTICQKYGCGKPSWNGKMMEYCSHACRQADNLYWTSPTYGTSTGASYGTSYGTSGTSHVGSYGTSGTSRVGNYGTSGTTLSSAHGPPSSYGASAVASGSGAHSSSYAQSSPHGMGGATSAAPAICKTVGCGKPTWNGKAHEYCSKTCKEATIAKATGGPVAGGMGSGFGTATGAAGAGGAAGMGGAGGAQQPVEPGDGAPAGQQGMQPKKKRWGIF